MRKIFFFVIILLIAALLAGCAKVSMEYKIDDDHKLEVTYALTIDKSIDEFKNIDYFSLKKVITNQWERQGFKVDIKETADELSFAGVFESQNYSRQQAYASLNALLKSDYSPFVSTGFEYAASYFEDEYNLKAKISLIDLIRRNDVQAIPADVQQTMMEYLNESEFSLSVTLPGQAELSNADLQKADGSLTKNTWKLKYGEEREIELKSILTNEENIEYQLTSPSPQTKLC